MADWWLSPLSLLCKLTFNKCCGELTEWYVSDRPGVGARERVRTQVSVCRQKFLYMQIRTELRLPFAVRPGAAISAVNTLASAAGDREFGARARPPAPRDETPGSRLWAVRCRVKCHVAACSQQLCAAGVGGGVAGAAARSCCGRQHQHKWWSAAESSSPAPTKGWSRSKWLLPQHVLGSWLHTGSNRC